jgi:hypothetical protein
MLPARSVGGVEAFKKVGKGGRSVRGKRLGA